MSSDRRVLITGMGVVTPLGLSVKDFWEGVVAGKCAAGPITAFDASPYPHRIAAEVRGFDPLNYMEPKEAKRMSRFTQFAMAAAKMAVESASLDLSKEDPNRMGLEIGSAVGGFDMIEQQSVILVQQGSGKIKVTFLPSVLINMAACQVAIHLGIRGPAGAPVAACATGVVALGEATRRLQRREADVMIAGGTDSVLSPLALVAFGRLGALSTRNDEPEKACRPFDAQRDGTMIGEGAAVLVLETEEHARRRGARVLGEVAGYGFTVDAYHMTAPEPNGNGSARAMKLAIQDAGMTPKQIDYIASHGTATTLNDIAETRAIKSVFGEDAYKVAINSIKSMVGHLMGAAGTISAVASVKAMEEGIIPATINLDNPDPECDLDYVPNKSRKAEVNASLVNAFGFGGQNASLVVRRYA